MKRVLSFIVAVMFAGQAWAATTFTIGNLKYTVTDETNNYVSVGKGSTKPTGALEIPSTVKNGDVTYTVTSIGNYAFYDCIGLKSVIISESVINVDYCAFRGCSGLISVTIGNSVTNIGSCAFHSCSGLTSITIPSSVTDIGSHAFYGCSGLTSVTIPEMVTTIGANAFRDCSGLTSVTIGNSVINIGGSAFSGCSGLQYNKYDNALYFGNTENPYVALIYSTNQEITSCNINENCKCICDYAFCGCSGLITVTIPNSVTSIGNSAFSGCSGLTTVTIPNSVTSIGNEAFYNCSSLTSVTIPNLVTNIGSSAFSGCSGLTTVTIPNSVTSIGSSAFSGCSGLTSVTISNSVTSIGGNAFRGCGLTSITIPNSVTSIGNEAFYNCSSLTSVTIPNSVTSIRSSAFSGCSSLTSVTIPNSVTSIGNEAFYNCSKLTDINVESNNTAYTSENGVLFNKDKTTIVCYPAGKDAIYTIPNSVTSIGFSAFFGCSGLTSVTIGNSVTSIGDRAFEGCSGLKSICYEGNSEPTYRYNYMYNSFDNVDKTIPVCVPAEYSSDSWCGFTNLYKGHDIVNDPATVICTEAGLSEGTHCSKCGRIFVAQEAVNALGHTEVSDVAIEPTCTEPGKTAGKHCSICNAVLEGLEVIPATGHTYNNTVTAPTCTAVGYTTHTCSVCEYTYNSDTVDAKGHKADSVEFENIVPATCTVAGSKDSVVFCSVCQAELFREEKEIAVKGHTYNTTITAPTCTAVGFTTHTCSVCEYTYNSDTVDAKGHKADSVEFENIIPATCIAAGSKDSVIFCSVCEVELSREERAILALGHTEVIDDAIAATCTATGKTEGKHCSVCNAVLVPQEKIAALGHEFKDYVYNNDATTAADGTETATCTRGCGATDTRTAAGTKLAETPEKGTAVSDAAASTLNIYAHHNTIVVENATDEIRVYDAMGKLVCRDAINRVRAEITINGTGVYIVKTGNVVKRVMVN